MNWICFHLLFQTRIQAPSCKLNMYQDAISIVSNNINMESNHLPYNQLQHRFHEYHKKQDQNAYASAKTILDYPKFNTKSSYQQTMHYISPKIYGSSNLSKYITKLNWKLAQILHQNSLGIYPIRKKRKFTNCCR